MNIVSEGRHSAKAIDYQLGKASTGTEQVAVTFELVDGDYAGVQLVWFGFLTDDSYEHTFKALAVMGWPKGKELHELTAEDLGSLVHLVIVHEDGQKGGTRARIRWVNRPGRGTFQMKHKLEGAEARKLGAKWKTHAAKVERYEPIPVPEAVAAPKKAKAAKDPHPNAPGNDYDDDDDEDDVPF